MHEIVLAQGTVLWLAKVVEIDSPLFE